MLDGPGRRDLRSSARVASTSGAVDPLVRLTGHPNYSTIRTPRRQPDLVSDLVDIRAYTIGHRQP